MDGRRVGTALLLVVLAAAAPLLLTAACGRRFLYYPTGLGASERAGLALRGWQNAELAGGAGPLVGLVRPGAPGAPWLLLFGGNAMDLGSGQYVLELVAGEADVGLAVFAYRGYDGSAGSPTEAGLCDDSEAVAGWLERQHGVEPERLVLVGQSLGTGVAVHLGAALADAHRPPAGLILISPYTSVARLFDEHVPLLPVGWLAPDPFRTDARLARLASPVLILHGQADTLIPISHGRANAAALGPRGRLVELPDTGHNDVWENPLAASAARAFLAELFAPASR